MNAGLGSLQSLKVFLLGQTVADRNDFDLEISAIGLGVAASFERFCNRDFGRVAGAQDVFRSDKSHWHLRRYPVETVSAVDQKDSESQGWVSLTVGEVIQLRNDLTGLIDFGAQMGAYNSLVRVTYTGGYWWDATDEAYGNQPAGSTIIPDDLVMAWKVQSQHLWGRRDKVGSALVSGPDAQQRLGDVDMIPSVGAVLQRHIRYQMI